MEKISINNYQKELKNRATSQKKGINNRSQEIVSEICSYFGSNKEFGLWCGVARRIGPDELKNKFKDMVSRKIKNERYLLAMCRKS